MKKRINILLKICILIAVVLAVTGSPSPALALQTPVPGDPAQLLGEPDGQDTFDSDNNWTLFDDSCFKSEIADGQYVMTANGVEDNSCWEVSWPSIQNFYLETDSFTGLRFVGRFSQGPNPVTNTGLTYIYQGGTYDAEYLIAFFYPVSTGELPDAAGEVSSEEMQQVDSDPTAYLEEKAAQLNNLNPEDWQPDLTVLDAVISSLQFEKSAPQGEASSTPVITGQLWSWIELIEDEIVQPTIVPYPDRYTLIFYPEGRFDILADCNSGSGSYQIEGDSLTMTVEIMTMAFCSPESLSDQFINLIGAVESFTLEGNQLHLTTNEGETMLFSNSGPVVGLSEVPAEVPTAVALEPLNIRSGPGSEYPSYGTAPIGATGEVIGVSEDSGWWVVKIPAEVAPDQHGWVNANYVQVTGAEDVPVVPAP